MKKPYMIPDFEIERYELNTSIASGCGTIVKNGPEINEHTACEGFEDIFGEEDPFARGARSGGASFYDDGSCRCYYSSGGEGYWTS